MSKVNINTICRALCLICVCLCRTWAKRCRIYVERYVLPTNRCFVMSGFSRVCHLPKVICFALFCLTGLANSYAQSAETQFMRRANRYYNAKAYDKAIEYYEKTLELDSMNTRARYNLGNTYLAQRKPKEAMKEYEKAVAQEKNPFYKAAMYHNMGVILQSQKQFGPAIDCYKNSLRNYPVDDRTRYNLALCQHQLKNQPQDQNQQSQNNNQDQKKNEQQQKQPQKQDEQQRQEQKSQMSKENADQMLRAAMMQENRTQQKLNQHKQRPRRRNAEKNW